jgi:polysaccharide pyruvyl transferase WcaK-like protein
MKYHGLVFSACAAVPFVNIGNTRKNLDLCADAGLGAYSVPMDRFGVDEFLEAMKRAEAPEAPGIVADVASANRSQVESLLGSMFGR